MGTPRLVGAEGGADFKGHDQLVGTRRVSSSNQLAAGTVKLSRIGLTNHQHGTVKLTRRGRDNPSMAQCRSIVQQAQVTASHSTGTVKLTSPGQHEAS